SFPLTFPLGSANSTLCPACSSRFGLGFAVGGTSTSFLREGEAPAEPSGGRGSCRAFGRARLLPSLREGEAPAEPSGGRGSCRAFESGSAGASPSRRRKPPRRRRIREASREGPGSPHCPRESEPPGSVRNFGKACANGRRARIIPKCRTAHCKEPRRLERKARRPRQLAVKIGRWRQ